MYVIVICKCFMFQFLYILKYLQKTHTTYISVTLQLQPLFARETEFVLPVLGKIPFQHDNPCSSIPNFNFTIPSTIFTYPYISIFGTSTQSTYVVRYAVNLTTKIHVWKALIFVVVCVFC